MVIKEVRIWLLLCLLTAVCLRAPNNVLASLTISTVSSYIVNTADDELVITATASGLQNSTQYFQAAFTKNGETTNYLGLTKNSSGEWYQYKYSPTTTDFSSYFFSFLPVGGVWSGQVSAKIDISDDGFKGTGTYNLKLIKYITSSTGSDSNIVSIVVNVTPTPTPTPTPTATPTPTPVVTAPSSTIDWSIADKANLGENIKITLALHHFDSNTSYLLKFRAGLSETELNKGQTVNGNSFLSDTESWSRFPVITTDGSGEWSGTLFGRVDEGKGEGTYKARVKAAKQQDTDSYIYSDIKTITLSKLPLLTITPILTASPSPSVLGLSDQAVSTDTATINLGMIRILPESSAGGFPLFREQPRPAGDIFDQLVFPGSVFLGSTAIVYVLLQYAYDRLRG